MEFAKKSYVSLKSKFGKEPDFSQWLANDGIEYIKQALGIELISEGTEVKPHGQFSTDIVLSVDPQYTNGKPAKVVIENQYGRSNHNHFSKLITYAVTNEAKYAVWICEDVHPEHKSSIDWLNENTNDNINFYVFKAVIEKIGDSAECFSLIPICEPNEEKKICMSEKKELSELHITQLRFWQNFASYISIHNFPFKARKAQPQHWYNISVGSSNGHISICILSVEKKARIDFWISDNKEFYDKLYSQKDKIETSVGRELIWDRKEGSKASSVSYLMPDEIDIYNEEKYDEYAKIILDEINNHFYKFSKFVK